MIPETEYAVVHLQESSYAEYGHLGIKISIAMEREVTDDEHKKIIGFANQIKEMLITNTISDDPEAKKEGEVMKNNLLGIFGDENIVVYAEIKNEYCTLSCCQHRPWFIVTTPVGNIKIGWRKRVINIDWTDSDITQCGEALFPDENVTKSNKFDGSGRYIHAYGYEKAKEYVQTILNIGKK